MCLIFNIEKPCIAYFLKSVYFSRMSTTGRRTRIHIPNTIHHVMMRGNNRQRIFYNQECFLRFISIIAESTKKFDHQFLCYCFMTNHILRRPPQVISIQNSRCSQKCPFTVRRTPHSIGYANRR